MRKRKTHPNAVWDVRGRIARLLKLHAAGWASPKIAAHLGVGASTVRNKLRALGLAAAGGGAWKFVRREKP